MIEHLGINGVVRPDDDDADIRDEFACAGREAAFGFDTIGAILGRSLSEAGILSRLRRQESSGGHRSSAAAQLLLP